MPTQDTAIFSAEHCATAPCSAAHMTAGPTACHAASSLTPPVAVPCATSLAVHHSSQVTWRPQISCSSACSSCEYSPRSTHGASARH
eukprot:1070510-Prorocentrum_lima.AAC.1